MAEHNLVGKKGEKIAKHYLLNNGYRIRDLNWRNIKNEIDIIAEKKDLLIVVEVKTRTSEYFENPKEAVTRKKQKHIVNAAEAYINQYDIKLEVRFDVIAVTFLNKEHKLEHIVDAFQPSLL